MQTQVTLIISNLLAILFLAACNNKPYQASMEIIEPILQPAFDTFFVWDYKDIGFRVKHLQEQDSLSRDSTQFFAERAKWSNNNGAINLDYLSDYDAYADKPFVLGKNTWGRLIYFRPHSNNYNSLQLYIMDKSSRIKDAIEVGYWFEEEGVSGLGQSFIVKENDHTIIYNQQYWVNYYTDFDNEFVADVSVDTVVAYKLQGGKVSPFEVSKTNSAVVKSIFFQH